MNNFVVDAERGLVFSLRGKPITKRTRGGYVQVTRNSKPVGMAHRLIWEHVNGKIPDGLQINHINGVKWDNRIDNLEVVTPSENLKHAYDTGLTSAVGEKNGRSKLTAEDVRLIRQSTSSLRTIAREFGVALRTVRNIRDGVSWRHA